MKSGVLITVALPWVLARDARADQLTELIAAAHGANLELREQEATIDHAEAQVRVERSARYPSLGIELDYAHVADPVLVALVDRDVVLVPSDALRFELRVEVPVFDVVTSSRIEAAEAGVDAQRAIAAATEDDVDRAVVIAYYRWVAGTALVEAAREAEQIAGDTQRVVDRLVVVGTASTLDVARAKADVARAQQRVAEGALVVADALRELRSLTGTTPAGDAPPLSGDTGAEPGLDTWMTGTDQRPTVRAASAAYRASEVAARAAHRAWLPELSLFGAMIGTNAAGFGETSTWTFGVNLSWTLDLRVARSARVADAAERIGAVRVARATEEARDLVTGAWDVVEARRVAADAAADVLDAADEGLAVAQARIDEGLATALDLLEAQRDRFAAALDLVQANADLAAARALLRLAAGRDLGA